MLHPCTWSFPCWLVKHMSWVWASWVSLRTAAVSRGLLMIARKTESTEADDTHAARCVCPHGWAHSAQPMRGKGGFVVSEQVLEAASQRCRVTWIRESPHAPCPPREKKKNQSLSYTFALPLCFHPASIHLLQLMLNRSMIPLVPGSEFGFTLLSCLYCFPFFTPFLYCMPNPLIW